MLCAYFAGANEGENDVAIWLSTHDQKNWSEPKQVAAIENRSCWNPVLFTLPSGEILLFYKGGPSPQTWSGFLKRSNSHGKEWSDAELLPAGILGPIRSKPLLLENGTLLCGSSIESWRRWGCWVDITHDLGKTWVKSHPINLATTLLGVIQPSLFKGKDGHLNMVMRPYNTGAICQSNSTDYGHTWSDAVPIDLPNPNAAVEALSLFDGRVILIFNDSKTERYPLSIALSSDDGKSWERAIVLEDQEGEFSYPAAIQTSDGLIHITYTYNREKIKHVVLDPKFLHSSQPVGS